MYKDVNFGPKLKYTVFISRHEIFLRGLILLLIFILTFNFRATAQDIPPVSKNPADSLSKIQPGKESISKLKLGRRDSISSDSVRTPVPVGDISTTVKYTAKDSISLNVLTKIVHLYGQSDIDYEPIGLQAEIIEIDWNTNTLSAEGKKDSLGKDFGAPIFTNGSEVYETRTMKYNFKTQKAIISGLVTEQGEGGGIIHGEEVYKNEKNELFIPFVKYTTCNLSHPHFYIAARNVKAIPDNKMISGPFNMVVNDVPTPLGFVFGMFPQQSQRESGIIVPSYGEQQLKGYYLENGGYFFALSDYINLTATGSIYSKGGYGVNLRSRYVKRYHYSGNFLFNYTKQNLQDESEAEPTIANDFRLTWSHSPKSKGSSRFSANINASTSTYNQNNVLESVNEQVKTTLSSSVSYSKTFRGTPLNIGLNARFNQNLKTKKVDLLLPEFSANVQNIYPFQSKTGGANSMLDRLTFRYTLNGVNKITNQVSKDSIAPFDFQTFPKLVERASNGMKHTIPVSTSLKALKYFTVSPSFNYQELWYSSQLDHSYDTLTNSIVTDTLSGFQRVYSYSASVGMNTRIYGTYFFNRETGIQAIRHVFSPSISYSYRPDFSDPKFDYWQEVQSNENGDTRMLSRYQGYVYGSPGAGKSSSLSLSITNTLEMKVKSKKDTTGTSSKVALLRNFGLSSSYNFAADSFQLSNISVRATTNLLNNKKIFNGAASTSTTSLNLSGTIDPYVYVLDSIGEQTNGDPRFYQRKIDKYAWNNGDGLGQFANVTFSLRTGIRANSRGGGPGGKSGEASRGSSAPHDVQQMQNMLNSGTLSYHEEALIQSILDHPEAYVDFNVPWSLSLTYSLNYRKRGFEEGEVTQTVRFNGDLSLSEKWKLTYNSGYDFVKKEWTMTRLGIHRDMHCWEMNISWVPFGRYTSYDFTFRAKSSILQDLKVNRKRTFQDNIF